MKRLPIIALMVLPMLLFGTLNYATAQGKLGVFVGGGTMIYQGDLVEQVLVPLNTVRWTVDAGLHWQITKRLGLQLNYTLGQLAGDDAYSDAEGKRIRNLSFVSLAHEVSLRGTFDILRNDKWKLIPYVIAGVGGVYNDITPGTANAATASREEAYSNFTLSIPTGVGLKYQISCPWVLKAEGIYHWTLSDYLDDVSQRGNPDRSDGYFDINIGVIYFFVGCNKNRRGGKYEDCEQLNGGVDMDKLMRQYGGQ